MPFALMSKPKGKSPASVKPLPKRKAVPGLHAVDMQPGFEKPVSLLHATSLPIAPLLQTKLTVGEPNDKFEKEADRVADEVMRMPEPRALETAEISSSASPTRIQRVCPECEEQLGSRPVAIQRMCPECDEELHRQPMEEEEEETIQAKEISARTPEVTPGVQAQISGLQGNGQRLPESVRAFFEPRLGYNFSQVRIHANQGTAESARVLNARAFTVGEHVVFGSGEYRPGTSDGRRLLGHELTHVVQQRRGLGLTLQRQAVAPPNYRDCTPAITGRADANQLIENARLRARRYVGAAIRALAAAPAAGSTYAAALNRHFIAPTAAQRGNIRATYQQIMRELQVRNFICNTGKICDRTTQAFWIADDQLIHVCPHFWDTKTTICQAIIFVHEAAHDVGIDAVGPGHAPNRGSVAYPIGNVAPPAGQATAARLNNPDAYAFFAAHIARNTDIGRNCF